jgi:hypothetical protein
MTKKLSDYSNYKTPNINCKYCNKELSLTSFSMETFLTRGPHNATYLYRCECSHNEVQVLPLYKYPKIGEPSVYKAK